MTSAATDMAAPEDRWFRGLFGGKVMAIPDHPETILYSYLTTPRLASPRWYHEGIATFTQTWMAGGLGRAQGAYDVLRGERGTEAVALCGRNAVQILPTRRVRLDLRCGSS